MNFLLEINYYFLTFAVVLSYLIGSVSFGIIVARLMNLGNLRSIGSGNIGATNVLRTGSKTAAALTVLLDGGKGYLVIYATISFFEEAYLPITGIAVFLGHTFPIYYKFKGGKGVATFLGVILATNGVIGITVCGTWLLLAILSQKSSLAALGCSLATPLFLLINKPDEKVLFAFILTLLIWWLHEENIKRLMSGTEPSIKLNKNAKE